VARRKEDEQAATHTLHKSKLRGTKSAAQKKKALG